MLALIGGTGLNTLEGIEGFQLSRKEAVATRYSETRSRSVFFPTWVLSCCSFRVMATGM